MKVLSVLSLKNIIDLIREGKNDTDSIKLVDIDTTTTQNSNHLITSGAVAQAVADKLPLVTAAWLEQEKNNNQRNQQYSDMV